MIGSFTIKHDTSVHYMIPDRKERRLHGENELSVTIVVVCDS
jgi:hypothetical protein